MIRFIPRSPRVFTSLASRPSLLAACALLERRHASSEPKSAVLRALAAMANRSKPAGERTSQRCDVHAGAADTRENNALALPTRRTIDTKRSGSSPAERIKFPDQIRLTGRVFVGSDEGVIVGCSSAGANAAPNALRQIGGGSGAPVTGDIRLRRKFFTDDVQFAAAEQQSPFSRADAFADTGPSGQTSAFDVSRASKNGREIASSRYESIGDFGSRFHEMNGHEIVVMQKAGKRILNAAGGCILVDVRVAVGGSATAEPLYSSWHRLDRPSRALGFADPSFSSVGDAMSVQQLLEDFFLDAKGVVLWRHPKAQSYAMRFEKDPTQPLNSSWTSLSRRQRWKTRVK